MKTQINPYLTFSGNCKEAMNFYKNCFEADLVLQTVAQSPMSGDWPAHLQNSILHASLTKNNFVLLASDVGVDKVTHGNSISLAIVCVSEAEIEAFFSKLSSGGKVIHSLHKFYDGVIGSLTDKYGINWILKF